MESHENEQPTGTAEEQGKRTAKATVFTDLFSKPEYRLQLAQELHPEMTGLTLSDITLLTLANVLVDTLYNDLGLLVRNKLLIFLEAQATWSVNILPRLIMYLGETYKRLIKEKKWNVYGTKALPLPEPEFYVIYTGKGKRRPKEIKFSTEFFGGRRTAVEITAKVLYGGRGDIIGEYVTFCRMLDDQYRKHGRTAEAVRGAINICKDKNVLKKYLEDREEEVIGMMLTLFDQEVAERNYRHSFAREITERVTRRVTKKVTEEVTAKVTSEVTAKVTSEVTAKVAAETDKAARADQDLTRIRSLMTNMKLSAQDAMTALSIPPAQQAIYIEQL